MEIVVVGGGISGLATAYRLEQAARARGEEVTARVLESAERLGGKVDTRHEGGFVIEGGVNGWLDSKPATDTLCRDLGIEDERLVSNDAARKRYIFKNGRLLRLPESPLTFLKTGLLTWGGKLRLLREPWAPSPPADADETLADFARRRLGQEALDNLLDPMVSGVFAGDPERMSLASSFPRIAEIEREYGSLVRGLVRISKERRRERRENPDLPKAGPAGPGGKLISFAGGTTHLIEALAAALSEKPETSAEVVGLERKGDGWTVRLSNRQLDAERVVLAAPAWAQTRILDGIDSDLARLVGEVPYSALTVVAMAWKREDIPRDMVGFGFLIPNREGRGILGTLWDSSVFEHRAPDGYVLTRTMVGGARHGDLARRADDEVLSSVRAELGEILGVHAAPELVHLARHEKAIPQYVVGHAARLAEIDARLESYPGLFLSGNAYRGVGLNDCTGNAEHVAKQVLAGKG